MASIFKLTGTEQAFTSPNTFSSANTSTADGWNTVRIINSNTTTAFIVTVNTNPTANITVLPLTELIIEKAANTTITAQNAALLGTSIAFKNN